jgi:hypothetical protein
MVDAADARIRRDQLIRQFGDRFHGSSIPQKCSNASVAQRVEGLKRNALQRSIL